MLSGGSLNVLEGLIVFLSEKPSLDKVLDYISNKLCQEGNICGVTLGLLNEDNQIEAVQRFGYETESNSSLEIQANSDFPSATSLRNQKMLILDLDSETLFEDGVQTESNMFHSICYIPLSERTILILSFVNEYSITLSRQTFLECIRSVLKMFLTYQSKNYINENDLLKALTPRQELICKGILNGKTNFQIAEDLSYSISLIRQETIRIYGKMEVNGRSELKLKLANELERYSGNV